MPKSSKEFIHVKSQKINSCRTLNIMYLGSTCSTTSLTSSNMPDPDFVLEPGTFEIMLCVDMQEKAYVG